MPKISKAIRDAIKVQLTQPIYGFNDRLAALAGDYGIEPWAIDWSADSVNFIMGAIDPLAVEQSSFLTFPFTTIDSARSQNTNRVKFATFAGPVLASIEVHHSWPQESVLADFASYVDATEDAMIGALNDQNHQLWPGNLLWNGNVTCSRGKVVFGAENWLQSQAFACVFERVI